MSVEFVQHAIDKGKRIFDIGIDAARDFASGNYSAESKLLTSNGFIRRFARVIFVGGKAQGLFEWVRK